jgi:hypothetical protein
MNLHLKEKIAPLPKQMKPVIRNAIKILKLKFKMVFWRFNFYVRTKKFLGKKLKLVDEVWMAFWAVNFRSFLYHSENSN